MTLEKTRAIIFTDGGSRGNPGPSAFGVMLADKSFSGFLGKKTNNQAEYQAVIFALKKSRALGFQILELNLDSKLIYSQLKGLYKVKHKNMKPLWEKAKLLLAGFEKVDLKLVPREKNQIADRLVNEELDRAEKPG